MLTITLVLITWYLTKIYYTKTLTISTNIEDTEMVLATCSKCARTVLTHHTNLRSPHYCLACK